MSKSCTCKTGYQEGGPVETSGGTASPFTMSGGPSTGSGAGTADQYMSAGALPHYPVPNAVLMSMSLDKRASDPSTYNADQTARATRPKQAPVVPPSARFKKGGPVKTGYQGGGDVEDDDEEESTPDTEEPDDTDEEETRPRSEEEKPAEEEEPAALQERGGEEEAGGEEGARAVAAEEEEEADRGVGSGAGAEAAGGRGGGLEDQGEEAAAPAPVQLAAAQPPPGARGGEEAAEGARNQAMLDTRATGYRPGQAQATSDPSTENLRKVLEYTRSVFGLGGGQRQAPPDTEAQGPAPVATAAGSGRLPYPGQGEQPQAPTAATDRTAPTAPTGYGTASYQPRIGGQQVATGYGGASTSAQQAQARPAQAQAPPPAAAPPDAQQGLAAYMEGQRSFSPDEMTRLLDHGVGLDHKGDMGTALHRTFDDLVSAGNVDAASRMLQALRPSYDSLRAVMMAAVGQGEWDKAMQLAEKLNDLLPNGRSLDMSRTSDGNFTAIVHPSDRGGHVSSFSLTPQQFAQYANGPASLMDVQGTKGLENTLASLTGTPGAQGTRGGFAPMPYPAASRASAAGRLAGGTPEAQAEAARQVGQGEDPTAAARARLAARQQPQTAQTMPATPVTPGGTAADYAQSGVYKPGTGAGSFMNNWWQGAGATNPPRAAQPPARPTAQAAQGQAAPGGLGGLDYTKVPPGAMMQAGATPTPITPLSGGLDYSRPAQGPAGPAGGTAPPGARPPPTTPTPRDSTQMRDVPVNRPPGQQTAPGTQQAPRTPPAPITQDQSGQPLYPHTITYVGRDGRPTGRHSVRLSPTPTQPDDPQYVPQPTGPHLNSGDPNAGPGHYDQNGLWTGFSGVPGLEHPMSYERTMARNIAIARMFPDEYGPILTGGGGSQHSSITRGGGSQGTSIGATRLQQMGINPANAKAKMLQDEMAQFNARQHDYAVQTGETTRTNIKDTGETAREIARRQAIADGDLLNYYARNPPKDQAGKDALAAAVARQSQRGQNAQGFNPNRLLMGEDPTGPVHQLVPRPGAPDLETYRHPDKPPDQYYETPPGTEWHKERPDLPEGTPQRWLPLRAPDPGKEWQYSPSRGGWQQGAPKPAPPPPPPAPPKAPEPGLWDRYQDWRKKGGFFPELYQNQPPGP